MARAGIPIEADTRRPADMRETCINGIERNLTIAENYAAISDHIARNLITHAFRRATTESVHFFKIVHSAAIS
jgi:hypothetical protein